MLKVKPYSEHHAIKNVVFALEWNAPLASAVFEQFKNSKTHEKLVELLPKLSLQNAVTINVDALPTGGMLPQQLSGISYERMLPNGEPEWGLHLQPTHLLLVCGKYSRWVDVWAQAVEYLALVLPYFLQKALVNTIGLQYTDEFRSLGEKTQFMPANIFAPDSLYIPKSLLSHSGPCHSHHGYFQNSETPSRSKRLININVNVIEQQSFFLTQILCSHKAVLSHALKGSASVLLSDQGLVARFMKDMHDENKRIVGDLLLEEIKTVINFNKSPDNNLKAK